MWLAVDFNPNAHTLGDGNSSPICFAIAITHRKDAVYPPTIVGIPPMEDFYIGGASVKLFLPIFKMNFPKSWTSRCRRKAWSTTW